MKKTEAKRAVIICSFIEYPLVIKPLIGENDTVLCLDGGYDIAASQNIRPDIILGDFDSIESDLPKIESDPCEGEKIEILEYLPEKDFTDLELALRVLDPDEYPSLLIIGGTGGRLDQTAVNLQLITRYSRPLNKDDADGERHFDNIVMMDGRNRCFAVHGSSGSTLEIDMVPDSYLSLIPMTDTCEGVSLQSVKYPLEDALLKRDFSLTVSNEFAGDKAMLSLKSGSLLVMICSKRKEGYE